MLLACETFCCEKYCWKNGFGITFSNSCNSFVSKIMTLITFQSYK